MKQTLQSEKVEADQNLPKGGNTEHVGASTPSRQAQFKVIETTEDRYNDMMGAVPPIGFGGSFFLCGEPVGIRKCRVTGTIGNTYDAFFASNDYERYYTVDQPLTGGEFKQLIKLVAALEEPNVTLNEVTLCYVD